MKGNTITPIKKGQTYMTASHGKKRWINFSQMYMLLGPSGYSIVKKLQAIQIFILIIDVSLNCKARKQTTHSALGNE